MTLREQSNAGRHSTYADTRQKPSGHDINENDLWADFAAAKSTAEFAQAWLALQCRMIEGTVAGILLIEQSGGAYAPAAIWPDPNIDMSYLTEAAQQALSERRGTICEHPRSRTEGVDALQGEVHVAYPIDVDQRLCGVVVVDLLRCSAIELTAAMRQLHWGAGWLEALMRRRQATEGTGRIEQAVLALDLVALAHEHAKLNASAMAVANEIARRVDCERVAIGLMEKGQMKLTAVSHTAWFDRKSGLSRLTEHAMEEAFDEGCSVAYAEDGSAENLLNVAHRDLAKEMTSGCVESILLTDRGAPVGAITLHRKHAQPLDAGARAAAELAGSLLGGPLVLKARAQRWVAGHIIESLEDYWKALVGPRRPTLKLVSGLAALLVGVMAVVEGEFRVSARSVIEGEVQRAAVAPFDGYISEALVRAGDRVREGQVLARLEDKDLRLEALKWGSEREQQTRKFREALARHDRTAAQILSAQVSQSEAQLRLVEDKLARTEIAAPFDGIVVSGDLSQVLGTPVEQGKPLFEIAPLDAYRVILQVDERDIGYLQVDQTGELALSGIASERLPFIVKKVTPVSTAEEGRNYFRVEAQLETASPFLRPGMEGVGKMLAGEHRLLWIWTRTLIDWLRLALWSYTP